MKTDVLLTILAALLIMGMVIVVAISQSTDELFCSDYPDITRCVEESGGGE